MIIKFIENSCKMYDINMMAQQKPGKESKVNVKKQAKYFIDTPNKQFTNDNVTVQ